MGGGGDFVAAHKALSIEAWQKGEGVKRPNLCDVIHQWFLRAVISGVERKATIADISST